MSESKYDGEAKIEEHLTRLRAANPDGKIERVDLLFIGRELIEKTGKFRYQFVDVTSVDNDGSPLEPGEVRSYLADGNKRMVEGMPGTIYAMPQEVGSSTIWSGFTVYLGQWRNRDDCVAWITQDRAVAASKSALTKRKKEMKQDLALKRLRPFSEAYRRARPQDRPLILAWVIKEITKWR